LRRSRAANAFRKGVPNRSINFEDAYRMYDYKIRMALKQRRE